MATFVAEAHDCALDNFGIWALQNVTPAVASEEKECIHAVGVRTGR